MSQVYPRWELYICANPTEERAREILDRYERLDERIKVTYPEGETGASGSLNATLTAARGEFVVLFEGGDELAPDALFELVKLLQEQEEADLIYSDVDEIDEEGVRSDP